MTVEVNKLNKAYGNKVVLDNLCLTIPRGSVYGLVGKNGAGKTTLLNILAGICSASSGECTIFGQKVSKDQYESGILSYLPDLPNFFDYLTVEEYIRFIVAGMSKRKSTPRISEKDYIELGINGDEKIKSLSRGNKQKLGIFVAIITNPQLLILDEPASALDPVGRRDVMALIKKLRNQGMTILFSTHILSDLELVCDRIGFLHKGVIQREIDMADTKNGDYAIEITFSQPETDDNLNKFSHLIPGYNITKTIDEHKIICKPGKGTNFDQKEFLSAISSTSANIASIKRTTSLDLEAIMMEVLTK